MRIDPATSSIRDIYRHMVSLITPRPIAWVSTMSAEGSTNLAPFSFYNGVGANPPTISFCPANRRDGTKKDSLRNIEETGEFVVNLVSFDLRSAMNRTAADFEHDESEFEMCGIDQLPAELVQPPRVANSIAQFECRRHTVLNIGTGPAGANLVVGQIVLIHIHDEILGESGFADPARLDTIGRLGGAEYCRTTDRFELERPTR